MILLLMLRCFQRFEKKFYRWRYFLIGALLLLGGFLRTWNLATNPAELSADEIVNYVSARNRITSGVDIQGKSGIFFSDRVELRPPIYGYAAYASSRVFGENVSALRYPAAAFGVMSILFVYLLAIELFGSTLSAFFAALFFAVLPWTQHFGRVGFEPSSVLPFLLELISKMSVDSSA